MGDDITIELRNSAFGAGYNSFIFGETGNSAFTAESTSGANIHSENTDKGTFEIAVAKSVQELTQVLMDHADASGAVMGVDVGVSADALSKLTFTATDTYVVARVCIGSRTDALQPSDLAFTGSAAALLPQQFIPAYGDRYVGEIHLGGLLTLIITVSSSDLASKQRFDTDASAKSGTFDAANVATFYANLQSILNQQKIDIYLAHIGGAPPPSDVRDLDVTLKYALSFQASAIARPAIFEAVCFTYSNVPNAPAGLEAFVDGPRANLESLVTEKLGYLDSRGSFEYVIANADALGIAEDQLKALEGDLNHLNRDIRLIDSSWRQSDVTTIPNAASLRVTNTPEGYQSIIDRLDLHIAARLPERRGL
jgi:hypothetical protein